MAWGWRRGPDGSIGGSTPRTVIYEIGCLAFDDVAVVLVYLGGILFKLLVSSGLPILTVLHFVVINFS